MSFEIKVPPAGESVTEAIISEWAKKDGDHVKRDEIIVVLETDKASMEVVAENEGQLSIKVQAGETVKVGQVIGVLDDAVAGASAKKESASTGAESGGANDANQATAAPGKPESKPESQPTTQSTPQATGQVSDQVSGQVSGQPAAQPAPEAVLQNGPGVISGRSGKEKAGPNNNTPSQQTPGQMTNYPSPAAQRVAGQAGMDLSDLEGTGRGGRVTKEDAVSALGAQQTKPQGKPTPAVATNSTSAGNPDGKSAGNAGSTSSSTSKKNEGETERVPMTMIRKRIAERLVQAQQTAAILTTFNEIDMTNLMALRNQYKDAFEKKHGVKLGFMGLFAKACVEALKEFPAVNASLDGTDILYHHFYNIGVAVSTPRGLMVPVVRNVDQLSIAGLEKAIGEVAVKARDGKISVDDLSGGTFSITNGGVFGSLMSTPILNPPQSAILGMHKIEDRPVVVNKEIVIRPMMYLALSYDHRMIDGRESVSFLVKVKQFIEDPQRLLLEV